ncbi:zinc-ribbon domain-containing protein [Clostridium sp.]|uniref:zinc-ribbon domain-containing protein n=1 Tax=Clostridium sp. TaxID=1506 RepID=UPI00261DDB98|nr:zinc-ribbon domain-containing protein [Clostridium sp.]
MLISKEKIKLKWTPSNKFHYESKGYVYTKFGDEFEVKLEDLSKGSNVKVEVKCDCEDCKNPYLKPITWNNYKRYVHEDGKYYCKSCVNKLFGGKTRIKNKLKNGKVESFGYWLIKNLSLKQAIEIIVRWDDKLNGFDIREVGHGSTGFNGKGYYFKYPRGIHSSEIHSINGFSTKQGGELNCKMCNSFAQWGYDNVDDKFLEKYWDYDMNKDIDPWKIARGNNTKKIWIKCDKHGSYIVYANSFTKEHGSRCPDCAIERTESILQCKVRLYLESLNNGQYTILHEQKCTIVPLNPKRKGTNYTLPFDNEIKELKLIIEVNGIQHYKITGLHKIHSKRNGSTPKYELHYQKVKDRYKRMYVKSQGYKFLEIPYWTDNKKEIWKQLIDNKINEILNMEVRIND